MNQISIGVSIIMALLFLILGVTAFKDNTTENFVESNYSKLLSKKNSSYNAFPDLPIDQSKTDDLVNSLYKNRTTDYFKNSQKMSNLIQLISAMIIVGLLILFYKPTYLKLPVISINIPDTLLYLFVSVGLIYLWIQFGLTLNSGIDSRLALIHMTKLHETIGDEQVTYAYSNSNVYSDNGIIDTWCSFYYNIFEEGNQNVFHKILGFFGLFGIYGVFVGFIHATCFTLVSTFYSTKKIKVILILFYFSIGMFILSGVSFVFEFRHGALFMAWVWSVVAIFVFWWDKKGILLSEKLQKENGDINQDDS